MGMAGTSLNIEMIPYTKKTLLRTYANGLHSFLEATNGFPDAVHIWLSNLRGK